MNTVTGAGALARLAARRDRLMLPAWLYVLTATLASTGYSFKSLYKTPASREAVYQQHGPQPDAARPVRAAVRRLGRRADHLEVGSTAAVLAALMSIFLVIRHTRADEEAGRLELIGSTAVGRHAALAVGLILAAVANVVLALLITVALIAVRPAGRRLGRPRAGHRRLRAGLHRGGRGHGPGLRDRARRPGHRDRRARRGLPARSPSRRRRGAPWLSWLSPIGWAERDPGRTPATAGWCSRCRCWPPWP